jgi:phosphatidylserine/phosphatidylglycerophosphate/cardiolipin synthase-like enzyme
MSLDRKIYVRSVIRRAKEEIKNAPNKVLVFSPYLTSNTAETVVHYAIQDNSEIYTTFRAETFASGGSSLKTIRKLHEMGLKIYCLAKLHAKIVLTDKVAIVGSQNLTRGGTLNQEVSVVLTKENEVEYLRSQVLQWIAAHFAGFDFF